MGHGPAGQTHEVDAVVDTGFNGYLVLPPVLVANLGAPVVGDGKAVLVVQHICNDGLSTLTLSQWERGSVGWYS